MRVGECTEDCVRARASLCVWRRVVFHLSPSLLSLHASLPRMRCLSLTEMCVCARSYVSPFLLFSCAFQTLPLGPNSDFSYQPSRSLPASSPPFLPCFFAPSLHSDPPLLPPISPSLPPCFSSLFFHLFLPLFFHLFLLLFFH